MSTDRDTTRIVRSWLRTDEHESAEHILDAVLERVDTTPQRRVTWWPARRLPTMNNTAKLALAAAAVVVVAFLGMRFMLPANVGGPTQTPVPTAPPSPLALPAIGTLEPGTYVIDRSDFTPRSFTVTLPAGWSTEGGFITKGNTESVALDDVYVVSWVVTHVFADACLRPESEIEGLVEARTPGEITDALATQGGHETTGPTAVTLGGFPAQRLEFNFPDTFDLGPCEGVARLWPDAGPDLSGGLAVLRAGQSLVIYVVDIDGEAAVIAGSSTSDASASDVAELQGVMASIRFAETAP